MTLYTVPIVVAMTGNESEASAMRAASLLPTAAAPRRPFTVGAGTVASWIGAERDKVEKMEAELAALENLYLEQRKEIITNEHRISVLTAKRDKLRREAQEAGDASASRHEKQQQLSSALVQLCSHMYFNGKGSRAVALDVLSKVADGDESLMELRNRIAALPTTSGETPPDGQQDLTCSYRLHQLPKSGFDEEEFRDDIEHGLSKLVGKAVDVKALHPTGDPQVLQVVFSTCSSQPLQRIKQKLAGAHSGHFHHAVRKLCSLGVFEHLVEGRRAVAIPLANEAPVQPRFPPPAPPVSHDETVVPAVAKKAVMAAQGIPPPRSDASKGNRKETHSHPHHVGLADKLYSSNNQNTAEDISASISQPAAHEKTRLKVRSRDALDGALSQTVYSLPPPPIPPRQDASVPEHSESGLKVERASADARPANKKLGSNKKSNHNDEESKTENMQKPSGVDMWGSGDYEEDKTVEKEVEMSMPRREPVAIEGDAPVRGVTRESSVSSYSDAVPMETTTPSRALPSHANVPAPRPKPKVRHQSPNKPPRPVSSGPPKEGASGQPSTATHIPDLMVASMPPRPPPGYHHAAAADEPKAADAEPKTVRKIRVRKAKKDKQ